MELYGGAASVLLKKRPSAAEVYNDLDGDVVNVFRVLRDPGLAARLRRQLELTPWSRREFQESYLPAEEPVERARRTITRAFMAFGTTSRRRNRSGFRAKPHRGNGTGVDDWANYPAQIPAFCARMRRVTLEERPALEVIRQQDSPDTLFYLDPPYPLTTRTAAPDPSHQAYVHELADADHRDLAAALHQVEGRVALSGYACPLYAELYGDWARREREVLADHQAARTECLWLNPACAEALRR